MNQAEAAYSEQLDLRKLAGEIVRWRYESVKLRLGHNCFLTPDFYVLDGLLQIEIHEVKGHMEDDARVKLATAASAYPELRFILARAKKRGGVWTFETSDVPAT